MQRSPRSRLGFTLVEVVMAIGLFAFALVSIFGLLGAATQSDLASDRDTVLVSMANQILNDLRPVPFDTLWEKDPRKHIVQYMATMPYPRHPSSDTQPADSEYYFTAEGHMLESGINTSDPSVAYHCTVVKSLEKSSNTESASTRSYGNDGRYNRMTLEMKFEWPVSAPQENRQGRNLYESISRYY